MKTQHHKNMTSLKGLVAATALFGSTSFAATLPVYNATELQNALKNASPGDEIVVHPGSYIGNKSTSGEGRAHFYSDQSGSLNSPIILRSVSKSNKQTLAGDDVDTSYVFLLEGDYWEIKNLKFTGAQKGIMLEGASHNTIDNVEVYNVGQEAVHFRISSSYNKLTNCYIHDTGKREGKEGTGEGVYIGTNNGHQESPADSSDFNTIGGCTIGPWVTAEAFDVKAGTTGTVIEYNHVDARGIVGTSASPEADSFVDLKGTDALVRNNVMDYKGDNNITHAIYSYREHTSSNIYDNEFNLPFAAGTFRAQEPTMHISNNQRLDGGSTLVWKDYQTRNIAYSLDQSIEQPNNGPYPCFDELNGACGGSPTSSSSSSSSSQASSSSSNSSNSSSSSESSSSSSSSSSHSSSATSCEQVAIGARTEVELSAASCVTFPESLQNKTLQVWDSNANDQCDFRGNIQDQSGSGNLNVTGNYASSDDFSGNTLYITPNNGCQFLKIRVY
ncbi:right-handed parallel beta-helix repeat-containing protein [Gilvimarinus agarilyticus]|uniref:right-handed parallel beta-helix repeat-containing protein n=1 Tax=Gilvimarinus sp. 2_MG-2023 TaxID=3062666 RepID=UPI001C09696F|nr:right-handed parallel beta-helix repeat-containing protein [Gilvimarinus sp. 2_MG-2023]MBU2886732.1 right-handed parallel beta-helix repeat-containing protein [Gilvimarinus agarilyticus]MDO6571398.1 right-handed parallel beta-helix repeat-containing protein [Gilvimarinus sp. 2_MG-2023]